MAHKNKPISDTWRWGLYLVIGVLFMAGVVFFSSWQALRATEARFCQTLDFVKSQSTSFEKYNDTVVAKALRRAAERFGHDRIVVLFKAGGLGFDKIKGLAETSLRCAQCLPTREKNDAGHKKHADDQIEPPSPCI